MKTEVKIISYQHKILAFSTLIFAFKVNRESLKEGTLKRLPYCGLAVLKWPTCKCELFIIYSEEIIQKATPHYYCGCSNRKYIQI